MRSASEKQTANHEAIADERIVRTTRRLFLQAPKESECFSLRIADDSGQCLAAERIRDCSRTSRSTGAGIYPMSAFFNTLGGRATEFRCVLVDEAVLQLPLRCYS